MSILNYFKPFPKESSGNLSKENLLLPSPLPDPHGPLCTTVPSSTIEAANGQVKEVLAVPATRGSYFKLTQAQRFQVGKRAVEHGIAAMIRYFEKKYLNLQLKETIVRRLKNLYRSELRNKLHSDGTSDGNGEDKLGAMVEEIPTLPLKKTRRPLMIGAELDK